MKLNGLLQSIGVSCFSSTPIKELTVPVSVRSIGEYAFTCCWNLKAADVQGG